MFLYILFLSSVIYLIFIQNIKKIKNLEDYTLKLLIKEANINIKLSLFFMALMIISIILLVIILKDSAKSTKYIKYYDLKRNSEKVNEYILVYILPFITVNTNDYKELTIFLLMFIIIGIVAVINDMVYVNPILYVMGYKFYLFKESMESDEESILITNYASIDLKRTYSDDKGNITIRSTELADSVYLVKKKSKN